MTRCERHSGQCAFEPDDPTRCAWCHRDWATVTGKDGETRAHHVAAHEQLDDAHQAVERRQELGEDVATPLGSGEPQDSGGNGTGNGHHAPVDPMLLMHNVARMQEDAPPCSECGMIMLRAGACYRCDNCGATSGCG